MPPKSSARLVEDTSTWSSPAFLKRTYFQTTAFDLFGEENEFPDNDRRKKTKFGRGSDQWRFAERTPSPAKDREDPVIDVETPSKGTRAQGDRSGEIQEQPAPPSVAKENRDMNNRHVEEQEPTPEAVETEGDNIPPSASQANHASTVEQDASASLSSFRQEESLRKAPSPGHDIAQKSKLDIEAERQPSLADGKISPAMSVVTNGSSSVPSSSEDEAEDEDEDEDEAAEAVSVAERGSVIPEPPPQATGDKVNEPSEDDGHEISQQPRLSPPSLAAHETGAVTYPSLPNDDEDDVRDTPKIIDITKNFSLAQEIAELESQPSILDDARRFDNEISDHDVEHQTAADIHPPASQIRDQAMSPENRRQDQAQIVEEAQSGPPIEQWMIDFVMQSLPQDINRNYVEQTIRACRGNVNLAVDLLLPDTSPEPSERGPSDEQEPERDAKVLDEPEHAVVPPPVDTIDPRLLFRVQEHDVANNAEKPVFVQNDTRVRGLDASVEANQLSQNHVQAKETEVINLDSEDEAENETIEIRKPVSDGSEPAVAHSDLNGPPAISEPIESQQVLERKPGVTIDFEESRGKDPGDVPQVDKGSVVDGAYQEAKSSEQQDNLLPQRSRRLPANRSVQLPSIIPDSFMSVKDQLPTPSTTQRTSFVSQPSTVSLQSLPEQDTLPSPELTQEQAVIPESSKPRFETESIPETSQSHKRQEIAAKFGLALESQTESFLGQQVEVDQHQQGAISELGEDQGRRTRVYEHGPTKAPKSKRPASPPPSAPDTPAKPKAPLIEKLKAMRRASEMSPRSRRNGGSTPASPWFAPRRSSQTVPDSEVESVMNDLGGKRKPTTPWSSLSQQTTPKQPPSKKFFRSPYDGADDAASVTSSQYVPPSQPVQGGLRTEYSYFPPLGSLNSHFGTETDVLAFVVAASSISRATNGQRDYTISIYITDFSMRGSAFRHKPLVTTQIFRPDKLCLPDVEHGDSILLRNFKVQSFHRTVSLISTDTSAWVVFRENSPPQTRGPPVEFGPHERAYARGHWEWWSKHTQTEKDALKAFVPEEKPKAASPPKPASRTPKASQNSAQVNGKPKPKKQGINGVGIELPNSNPSTKPSEEKKKKDVWSTQALAKEWADLHSSDLEVSDKEDQPQRRRGLRPRNTRGKTKSASPEREISPPPPRRGRPPKGKGKRDQSVKVESDESEKEQEIDGVKKEPKEGLRMHELRDGRKYKDRR